MDKIYITKKLIDNLEFSELDFDLHDEFGFDYETHEEFIEIEKSNDYTADGYPIRIDRMIEALQELKDKGATHVGMNDNCDHIGYAISGYSITHSSESEIDEYEMENTKDQEKNKKIQDLYNEIKKLKLE